MFTWNQVIARILDQELMTPPQGTCKLLSKISKMSQIFFLFLLINLFVKFHWISKQSHLFRSTLVIFIEHYLCIKQPVDSFVIIISFNPQNRYVIIFILSIKEACYGEVKYACPRSKLRIELIIWLQADFLLLVQEDRVYLNWRLFLKRCILLINEVLPED